MYILNGSKLNLNKIDGLRADKVTKQIVPFKKNTSRLPSEARATKKAGIIKSERH